MPKNKIRSVVSMFSGVGGLDMGFEGSFEIHGKKIPKLPFKIVAAYEKDEKCVETFRLNLRTPISQRELNVFDIDDIPPPPASVSTFRPGSQHSQRSRISLAKSKLPIWQDSSRPNPADRKNQKNTLFRSDTTDPRDIENCRRVIRCG